MKPSNYSKIFKALSNEQRLKIFLMIREKCCTPAAQEAKTLTKAASCCPVAGALKKAFSMVCGCINLSRSTISHHLKELENAGLITFQRDGRSYCCKVNEDAVDAIKNFLK